MKVPPNVVLGLVGAVVAAATATLIANDWETLTHVENYSASFSTLERRPADRTANVGPQDPRDEIYLLPANLTWLTIDLTWTNPPPLAQAPEVSLRVLDPGGRERAAGTHRGGLSGIHREIVHVPESDVPTGSHAYEARKGTADSYFQDRWPGHPETRGNWTLRITAREGVPVLYTLHVNYAFYEGTWTKVDLAGVK